MLIGYARVSKADGSQSLDLQRDALRAAGVDVNRVARQSVNLDRITPQWDDMLRTVGSLKLGRVPATGQSTR